MTAGHTDNPRNQRSEIALEAPSPALDPEVAHYIQQLQDAVKVLDDKLRDKQTELDRLKVERAPLTPQYASKRPNMPPDWLDRLKNHTRRLQSIENNLQNVDAGFRCKFENGNLQYSREHDVIVNAGTVRYRGAATREPVTADTQTISLPASGNLYIYVEGTIDPFTGTLTGVDLKTSASAPTIQSGDVRRQTIAFLEESPTGLWHLVQLHYGDVHFYDQGVEDTLHQFKSRIHPDYDDKVQVGYFRGDYDLRCGAQIHEYNSARKEVLDNTTVRTITLTAAGYIYQYLYKETTHTWSWSDVQYSATWPPNVTAEKIPIQIGYATWDSTKIGQYWQIRRSNPIVWPTPFQTDFEPFYVDNAGVPSVKVADGNVSFLGGGGPITGGVYPLNVDKYLYVELTSHAGSNQSLTLTATVQDTTGDYPDFATLGLAPGDLTVKIPIGHVDAATETYEIAHVGRLILASTLFQPNFNVAVKQVSNQAVGLLGLDSDEGWTGKVGLDANPILLKGRPTSFGFQGGDLLSQIDLEDEQEWHGLTVTETTENQVSGAPAKPGAGVLRFPLREFKFQSASGLLQLCTHSDPAPAYEDVTLTAVSVITALRYNAHAIEYQSKTIYALDPSAASAWTTLVTFAAKDVGTELGLDAVNAELELHRTKIYTPESATASDSTVATTNCP